MIQRLRARIYSTSRSDFGRRAIWFTALSGFERVIAVMQTVIVARALGITEYGVYGLLFGTIGLVASVVGLQMGLTATVFVSRYREAEKAKAAAVISIVGTFGWLVAVAFVALTVPFTREVSEMLLDSSRYQMAVLLGGLFIGATILSGVQDGIAQGFEIFGVLAKLKILASVLVFASIYPVASTFGLNGILCAMISGLIIKFFILQRAIRQCRAGAGIPRTGSGVSFLSLVTGFALPSMMVSLLVGCVLWFGLFLLSKQSRGFDQVAIVSTGLQWRGPILLVASSLGAVAVPAFSRHFASRDRAGSNRLFNALLLANAGGSLLMVSGLVTLSYWILQSYGKEFVQGQLSFALLVLSTVPAVMANVYLQRLVGGGLLWKQLLLHLPYVMVSMLGFLAWVPAYGSSGYAWTILLGSAVLLISCVIDRTILTGRGANSITESI